MKWSEHYWHSVPCVRARIEDIVRRAKGAAKVLEVGCNEGFLSQALIEAGFEVISVDVDPVMIRKSKENFGIDVVQADVNALPFQDGSFDLVIGGEILEHLDNPGKGLSELFRVSSDRVLITLPIGTYWLGEPTHRWWIDMDVIDHDDPAVNNMVKKLTVIEFNKRPKEA